VPPSETAAAVPGLTYLPDYLDRAAHDRLMETIDSLPWLGDLSRRVQHYGYKYDYKARKVDPSLYLGPLPDWAAELADRLLREAWFDVPPDQLIVNEYHPGQGIARHVDCVPCFGKTVVSLSLGSACVLEMARAGVKVPLLLEPRSALVLQAEARYRWTHAIAGRKQDRWQGQVLERKRRISLTFREVLLTAEGQGERG
jgi:alkylated DNA repair dioxygenase AlkB